MDNIYVIYLISAIICYMIFFSGFWIIFGMVWKKKVDRFGLVRSSCIFSFVAQIEGYKEVGKNNILDKTFV